MDQGGNLLLLARACGGAIVELILLLAVDLVLLLHLPAAQEEQN
jgi:hypothetical protein